MESTLPSHGLPSLSWEIVNHRGRSDRASCNTCDESNWNKPIIAFVAELQIGKSRFLNREIDGPYKFEEGYKNAE